MKKLKDILYKVEVDLVHGSTDVRVQNVVFDSRKIEQGDLFVAQKGETVDGHNYINKAIELGAKSIVLENLPEQLLKDVTYVQVPNSSSALAICASNYFDNPSNKLKLIGITGTNGKTTISTLLYELFRKGGNKVGLLSTVKIMVDEIEYALSLIHI